VARTRTVQKITYDRWTSLPLPKLARPWQTNQQYKTTTTTRQNKTKDDNNLLQEDIYYICYKSPLVLTKKQL